MKSVTMVVTTAACAALLPVSAQMETMEKVEVQVSSPKEKAEVIVTPAHHAKNTIRFITDFDSPPFSFMEGTVKKGVEIDFGEAIGKELGKKVEWIQMPFDIDAISDALNSGKADAAIASISITPAREEKLSFTKSYFLTSLAVATRKDAEWNADMLEAGLPGWEVGVLDGSTAEKWAGRNLTARVNNFPSVESLGEALKNAQFHEKFCILIDEVILVGILGRKGYRFKVVEEDIDPQTYGIAVKKGNTELLTKINSALETLDQSDFGKSIYKKWKIGEVISEKLHEDAADLPVGKRRKLPTEF